MWITTDYKGDTVKWYEAELINKIKQIALTNCLTCGECKHGFKFEQCGYNDILELIQENEK
jgi:hypothetical protein